MTHLNNDKKNDNHTISAATILALAIIMTASTVAAPAAATTMPQPVTVATDNQSVNVLISWEPVEIEPGQETELTLDFQDPSSGEAIDHVNYNFEILDQNGGTVQSMTDLHTHSGSDDQTVTFDTAGGFNMVVTIIGTGIDPPFDTTQRGTAQTVIPVGQQIAGTTGGNITAGTTDNITATTGGENATTTGAAGGNQSDLRMRLEEARTALQNNDTQGAMMWLDQALSALGGAAAGNMTGAAAGNMTGAAAGNMTGAAGDNATTTVGGGQVSEEEGGRIELEEERAEGEDESPGQTLAEEEG
jgi:hypothetical protein